MLKISYAAWFGPSVVILAQFVLEMCFTAQNRQKSIKHILMFKIIQGHCSWWQSKARIQLSISD